jgi:hypothetical protein
VEQFGLAVQAAASRGIAQDCSTWNDFADHLRGALLS